MKLGVHVSIAGGFGKALERTENLGCNTLQIFLRNPRAFKRSPFDRDDAALFLSKRREKNIAPLVVHEVYTRNLASSKKDFYYLTIKEFIRDIKDVTLLGAEYIVTHLGSFKGSTYQSGMKRVVSALKSILAETPSTTTILLENTSGSGQWLGAYWSELQYVFEHLKWPNNLGVCFDTCHAWAAGYDLQSSKGIDAVFTEIEKTISLRKIQVIHLNDTKDKLGSKKDRHAHIGEGKIGYAGFSRILNHPGFGDCAFILETPKDSEDDDRRNLEAVRSLKA